jgi:hypothetical protein
VTGNRAQGAARARWMSIGTLILSCSCADATLINRGVSICKFYGKRLREKVGKGYGRIVFARAVDPDKWDSIPLTVRHPLRPAVHAPTPTCHRVSSRSPSMLHGSMLKRNAHRGERCHRTHHVRLNPVRKWTCFPINEHGQAGIPAASAWPGGAELQTYWASPAAGLFGRGGAATAAPCVHYCLS